MKFNFLFIGILVSLCSRQNLKAQNVTLLMRDGHQINNFRFLNCSDTQLFSKNKVFELKYISSISFSPGDEEKAKPYLEKLMSSGITVFIGVRKIDVNGATASDQGLPAISIVKNGRSESTPYTSFGIGVGLDYGGIGARLSYVPQGRHLDLFFAGGYAIAGFGVNGGLVYNIIGHKTSTPTISLMYGYNGAIYISGTSNSPYNKLYYGPSLGVGYKFFTKSSQGNNFHLGIIIPFRPAQFQNDINALRSISYQINEPAPVLISVGYNFGTGKVQ